MQFVWFILQSREEALLIFYLANATYQSNTGNWPNGYWEDVAGRRMLLDGWQQLDANQ